MTSPAAKPGHPGAGTGTHQWPDQAAVQQERLPPISPSPEAWGRKWALARRVRGVLPLLLPLLLVLAAPAVAARTTTTTTTTTTTAPANTTTSEPFTFAIISDTHVGLPGDAERLREAVQRIRQLSPVPKLVVVAGDLTDGSLESQAVEYRRIMDGLPVQLFEVPGNHDEGFVPSPASLERFQRLVKLPPMPVVLTVEGRHFVGFDSQLLNSRRPRPGPDDIGHDQLDRLERLLEGLPPGPIFLVSHIPVVRNFVKGRNKPTWHEPFLRRFGEILRRHPVTAVIAGHFHRDELHFVSGAPLLVCPAISGKFGYIPSFRVVTHDERGLRYRQVYLGPRGRGRSYITDLRGMDQAAFRRQVMSYSEAELDLLWLRRYTGMPGALVTMGRRPPPDRHRMLLLADPTSEAETAAAVVASPAEVLLPDEDEGP